MFLGDTVDLGWLWQQVVCVPLVSGMLAYVVSYLLLP